MRILVFSAHVADFCSRSGGMIAKCVRNGDQVRVVCLTNGERSESGGLYANGAKPPLPEVRQVRAKELAQAAKILGVETRLLGWDDLGFDYCTESIRALAQEVRDFRPDAVLTHHGPDPMSLDHDTTFRLVMRATQVAGAPGLESDLAPSRRAPVFLFEATIPLTEVEGFNPDFYVDITDVMSIKQEALRAFERAQAFLLPWYTDVARRRAFQAQRLSGRTDIEFAEAFGRTTPWVGDKLPVNFL